MRTAIFSLVLLVNFLLSFNVNADLILHGQGLGNPIAKVSNDTQCVDAYQEAEQALLEKMPVNISADEAAWKLQSEFALVGTWFWDTQTCQVFNIKHLERFEPHHKSSHEVFHENLVEVSSLGKMIIGEKTNELGRVYFTVCNCPLCL